jgi:hypothetical protein
MRLRARHCNSNITKTMFTAPHFPRSTSYLQVDFNDVNRDNFSNVFSISWAERNFPIQIDLIIKKG